VSDRKEESTQRLVSWLVIYSLMAATVTIFLIIHVRRQSDRWIFDIVLLAACLAYVRSYALRLLKRGKAGLP
jgi:predicted membrane channel-forming protein YqfA (hemolysin III family)